MLRRLVLVVLAALVLPVLAVAPAWSATSHRWESIGPDAEGGLADVTSGGRLVVAKTWGASLFLSQGPGRWQARRTLPKEVIGGLIRLSTGSGGRIYAVARHELDTIERTWVLRTDGSARNWRVLRTYQGKDSGGLDVDGSTVVTTETSLGGQQRIRVSTDHGDSWRDIPWPAENGPLATRVSLDGDDLYVTTINPNFAVWAIRGVTGSNPRVENLGSPGGGRSHTVSAEGGQVIAAAKDVLYGYRQETKDWEKLLVEPDGKSLLDPSVHDGRVYAIGGGSVYTGRPGSDLRRWPAPEGESAGQVVPLPGWWGRMAVSTGRGLYVTDNRGRSYRHVGTPSAQVTDLVGTAGDHGREAILTAAAGGVYHAALPVREWTRAPAASLSRRSFLAAHPRRPSTAWRALMVGLNAHVERSDDGGRTWSLAIRQYPGFPTGIMVHPADPDRVIVTFSGSMFLMSSDGGQSWQKGGTSGHTVLTLTGDPGNVDRLWAGTSRGVLRSDDGGATFTQVNEVRTDTIAVDPRNPRRILAGGDDLRLSTDGGETFEVIEPAAKRRAWQIIPDPRRSGTFYAAWSFRPRVIEEPDPRTGVYRSVDGGQTWERLGTGLAGTMARALTASRDGRWLFAGTEEGSVDRLSLR